MAETQLGVTHLIPPNWTEGSSIAEYRLGPQSKCEPPDENRTALGIQALTLDSMYSQNTARHLVRASQAGRNGGPGE